MIGRSWRSVAPPALAAVAILGAGWWPARQANGEIESRREAADAQIADLQRQVGTLVPLADSGDSIEAQLTELGVLVPGDYDVAGFIVELDEIADRLGLDLRDVVPTQNEVAEGANAPGTPGGWSTVTLNIRVGGTYLDLIDFAEAITETDRLALIDSMVINSTGQGNLDAAISMRLFRNNSPSDSLIARYVDSKTPADAESSVDSTDPAAAEEPTP
ncbi:MAG: type 4a pilus biogenesis protein PilO [Actinomycetota bacterium]